MDEAFVLRLFGGVADSLDIRQGDFAAADLDLPIRRGEFSLEGVAGKGRHRDFPLRRQTGHVDPFDRYVAHQLGFDEQGSTVFFH